MWWNCPQLSSVSTGPRVQRVRVSSQEFIFRSWLFISIPWHHPWKPFGPPTVLLLGLHPHRCSSPQQNSMTGQWYSVEAEALHSWNRSPSKGYAIQWGQDSPALANSPLLGSSPCSCTSSRRHHSHTSVSSNSGPAPSLALACQLG